MMGVSGARVTSTVQDHKVDHLDKFLLDIALWDLAAMGWTLVFGLIAAVVAGITLLVSGDLSVFVVVRTVAAVGILSSAIYLILCHIHTIRAGLGVHLPDLIWTILMVAEVIISLAIIPLSQVTRLVLAVPLIDAVLLFVVVMVQVKTDSDSDDWDYLWNTLPVRWWRVQVTGLLTGLVVGLFLLSGQTLVVTRPEEILTWTDYARFGSFWVFVWVVATFTGSVLVGGIDLDHQSKRLA